MELSKEEERKLIQKLLFSRTRILAKYGFLGLLLMHMKIKLDTTIDTASTDSEYIFFSPKFLSELSDNELDFIMMHEILHVILKHCFRGREYNQEYFNIACDIVVNSIILKEHNFDLKSISLDKYGTSIHLTPKGDEGCLYTAEEVYEMLKLKFSKNNKNAQNGNLNSNQGSNSINSSSNSRGNQDSSGNSINENIIDDHSKWKETEKGKKEKEIELDNKIYEAVKAIERQNENLGCGSMPAYFQRLVREITKPQIDWRYVLNEFIQEEITDYTFLPPDSRYFDNDFFLPSFSDKDDTVKDILFMIDTSGSISDKMLNHAFSEVYGAITLFEGKLSGKLGFFDYIVYNVTPFEDVNDILEIKPKGGGGTSFHSVFEYIDRMDEPPCMLIILTDGYAEFPNLDASYEIPVLWLINNEIISPPFGKVARIKIN